MEHKRYFGSLLFLFVLTTCQPSSLPVGVPDTPLIRRLAPLHEPPPSPEGRDWRAVHSEKRQTFDDYCQNSPTSTTTTRRYIYLQLLNSSEERLLHEIQAYLNAFFGLPVRILPELRPKIPETARRKHPQSQRPQVRSTFLLREVLLPRLPDSAAVFVGFTDADLYPSESWNFVFGQANLRKRTGVWSWARFGEGTARRNRTLKTAAHEIGHIFSLHHCQDFRCVMAGSNNLNELDRHPMYLCPVCLSKLQYNLSFDPAVRYRRLAQFWAECDEALYRFYVRSERRLTRR